MSSVGLQNSVAPVEYVRMDPFFISCILSTF
jgi:hypothetical protein